MRYRAVRHSSFFPFVLAWCTLQLGCAAPQAQAAPPDRPEHAQAEHAQAPQEPRAHANDGDEHQARCPTELPNVRVEARDVERGVAIAFTGPADSVEAMRELTQRMASSYQRCRQMMQQRQERTMHQRPRGPMGQGRAGSPRMGMMQGRRGPMHMMLGADIQVRETPDGAEIIMLAENPEHVDALRARERWHVEMMRLGHCPMMGMMREMEKEEEQEPHQEQ